MQARAGVDDVTIRALIRNRHRHRRGFELTSGRSIENLLRFLHFVILALSSLLRASILKPDLDLMLGHGQFPGHVNAFGVAYVAASLEASRQHVDLIGAELRSRLSSRRLYRAKSRMSRSDKRWRRRRRRRSRRRRRRQIFKPISTESDSLPSGTDVVVYKTIAILTAYTRDFSYVPFSQSTALYTDRGRGCRVR